MRTKETLCLFVLVLLCMTEAAQTKKDDEPSSPRTDDSDKSKSRSSAKTANKNKGDVIQRLKRDVHADDKSTWPPKDVSLTDAPSKWPGHMKSLGSVGRTKEPNMVAGLPDGGTFFDNTTRQNVPVLFGNAIRNSTSFKHWQKDQYFTNYPHSATVWVDAVGKKDGLQTRVTLRNFIRNEKQEYHYVQQPMPSFLRNDITLPVLACDCLQGKLSYHELLFTSSQIHLPVKRKEKASLTCVYSGRLDVVLAPGTSQISEVKLEDINVEAVDYEKFPSLREMEYYAVTVRAGNCLYLPPNWFYQENADSRAIAVTVGWDDVTDCSDCSAPASTLYLLKFNDVTHTEDHLDNVLLHYFSNYIADNKSLNATGFKKEIKKDATLLDNMTKWTTEFTEIMFQLFEVLDVNKDKVYNNDDLEAVTPHILEEMKSLLEDRVADFEDIMVDQQEEKKMEKEKEAKTKMIADKYLKNLESLVSETIDEVKKDPDGIIEESIKQARGSAGGLTMEQQFKQAGAQYSDDLKDMMKQFKELMDTAKEADDLVEDLEKRVAREESEKKGEKMDSENEAGMKKEEL